MPVLPNPEPLLPGIRLLPQSACLAWVPGPKTLLPTPLCSPGLKAQAKLRNTHCSAFGCSCRQLPASAWLPGSKSLLQVPVLPNHKVLACPCHCSRRELPASAWVPGPKTLHVPLLPSP